MRCLFLKHIAQTSDSPLALEITSGKGSWLFDVNGKKYLDLIAGISVSALGHSHPRVVAAVKQQADNYMHTLVYGEYVLSPQVELAELLVKQLPESLNSVYFVSTGAEAVEGAMKLAKRHTGRSRFAAMRESYHGSTQGAMSLNSSEYFTAAYRPLLPLVDFMDFNEEAQLKLITHETAAVITQVVSAETGVHPATQAYLAALRRRCNEVGALLIFDEIQTGYGRTGALFAFEKYGVIPDVLLLAKGFGGGMPLGAFVADKALMEDLSHNPVLGHITTFGGHPVSCAAGLATLRELLESDLLLDIEAKSKRFISRLTHPKIKEIRAEGLLIAVDLDDALMVKKAIAHCIKNGLVTDWFLFNDRCLRIAPPLNISTEEIDFACERILLSLV